MTTAYLIIGAILMSAALVLSFRNSTTAAVAAFVGAWAMRAAGYLPVTAQQLLFWDIAVLMVLAISLMRRTAVAIPAKVRRFIAIGAIAGMAAGLSFHQAGAIVGSALGAIFGLIAYSRLSNMRQFAMLRDWLLAYGLPIVVTMSLVALSIQGLILRAG